jgi:hypothetical protein
MTVSSPVDRKKIRDALQEASNSMTRIESERDLIKDIAKEMSDNYQLSKKHVRKMIRVFHKQNFSEELADSEEFAQLYEEVVNLKSGV